MNGGQAVAEVLKREGVEVVFCFPSNPLIDAVASVGIRPIVGREERSVINMADAYTRVRNGKSIGVCMVQGGPGAEHAFGGIAQAYSDSVPVLFLPGGSARAPSGLRTTFDAVEAYRPITKWAGTLRHRRFGSRPAPTRLPEDALGASGAGRPGDARRRVDRGVRRRGSSPTTRRLGRRSAADPAAVARGRRAAARREATR